MCPDYGIGYSGDCGVGTVTNLTLRAVDDSLTWTFTSRKTIEVQSVECPHMIIGVGTGSTTVNNVRSRLFTNEKVVQLKSSTLNNLTIPNFKPRTPIAEPNYTKPSRPKAGTPVVLLSGGSTQWNRKHQRIQKFKGPFSITIPSIGKVLGLTSGSCWHMMELELQDWSFDASVQEFYAMNQNSSVYIEIRLHIFWTKLENSGDSDLH